jgi:uncharacterized protein
MTGGISLLCGALFACGLALANMGDPRTVLGAFQFDAGFDPRLYAMFAGSILVHAPLRALLRRRGTTLRGTPLASLPRGPIDARLVFGAVVFGVGWGLSGICPGPAFLVALTGAPHAVTFLAAMLAGFALHSLQKPAPRAAPPAVSLRLTPGVTR